MTSISNTFLPSREAQRAAVVDSCEDAILSRTLDGVILTWNGAAERIYGYTADEAVGKHVQMLLPDGALHDDEADMVARIAQGERVEHFETVRRTKSGELIDASITLSPTRDQNGRITGISHVARDVTSRKRAGEKWQHLAAIVESSDDAIISKTLEGRILTWNAGAERIYGYRSAEAIGQEMTMLLPEDRPNEEAEILARIARGERVDHFETVRRTKSGDMIDVSLSISPTRDQFGRVTGASHVARDITEKKRIDEQLRHTQKLESLGVLAGGVAHDFNNLLTGIMGNASLAIETLSGNNSTKTLLRDVLSAAERAALLTRQLLAYAGKGKFLIEPVNLSELIEEISRLIQTSISKNVQLRLDLRKDLPLVMADASQMQQLIMNLVINGAEAIGPQLNGTVLVTTGVQTVDEPYLQNTLGESSEIPTGSYVALEVHDTGCGMDEDTVRRIFDPFFTTKFTGRGLGLSAVQGIVQGHKGAIRVYSRSGLGTTFKVLFPATTETAELPVHVPITPVGKGELILVVDDEDIIRKTAKSLLEKHGYTVVVAEDGQRAVELFQVLSDKVAAVLLDMTMPVVSGEEAFRRLKSIMPNVKVLLSSGYNESEAIRRFTGKGLAGFIQKPYSSAALTDKVQQVLQQPA